MVYTIFRRWRLEAWTVDDGQLGSPDGEKLMPSGVIVESIGANCSRAKNGYDWYKLRLKSGTWPSQIGMALSLCMELIGK